MITAPEALERLRVGNERFMNDDHDDVADSNLNRRNKLVAGQKPFAVILGCSDSRVPAEIVFDQGLGTLFVIRVAGNIVAPSQIGSVEFAVEQFGTPLVVVMGHSSCGAVRATLSELERPSQNRSPNLRSIVDRIQPAVEPIIRNDGGKDPEALIAQAVKANILASVDQLRHGSEIIERLIDQKKLTVVGAEYSLDSGLVAFFRDGGTESP